MRKQKYLAILLCALLLTAPFLGCGQKTADLPPEQEATAAPAPTDTLAPQPTPAAVALTIAQPTAEPTAEPVTPAPTAEPAGKPYVFQPKVASSYLQEVFGDAMVETWFNLVDAVMAGETSFACPDDHTYNWVMGQFPDRCLPPLYEQIVPDAKDPDHPVQDGVGHFKYVTSAAEVRSRIDAFAGLVEGILNEVFQADDTDFEKAFALYKYFYETYRYDYAAADKMYSVYVDYLSAYRLLTTGEGICCEIAPAYAYLLLQAGVDAGTMGGTAHDWAYIKLNGRNYHVDPTFAIGDQGALAYFLMNDEQREREGFPKEDHLILSNYAQDHPHPDYTADDDTFRPLWEGFFGELDRESHTLRYRVYLDQEEGYDMVSFDYAGY